MKLWSSVLIAITPGRSQPTKGVEFYLETLLGAAGFSWTISWTTFPTVNPNDLGFDALRMLGFPSVFCMHPVIVSRSAEIPSQFL